MSFADDMNQPRYTQSDIDGLKQKYKRTHFSHFSGVALKPQKTKLIRGVRHVWKFGKWRKAGPDAIR